MRIQVPGQLISDVVTRAPGMGEEKPDRFFLLLHGFNHSGERIYKRLESVILDWEKKTGQKAFIAAPNGIYPVPEKTPTGWSVGFSWYFYKFSTDEYFIDMENSIGFLNGMIERLGLQGVPTTVIGFSQGGYLAPIFAQKCPQVDHVIGIGCEFLKDEITDPVRFKLDGIHGLDDAIVTGVNAQRSHASLVARGARGNFQLLEGEGHKISPAIALRIGELLG